MSYDEFIEALGGKKTDISYAQFKCHEAMGGVLIKTDGLYGDVLYDEWETMTDEEIEKRCDQWSENLRLQ